MTDVHQVCVVSKWKIHHEVFSSVYVILYFFAHSFLFLCPPNSSAFFSYLSEIWPSTLVCSSKPTTWQRIVSSPHCHITLSENLTEQNYKNRSDHLTWWGITHARLCSQQPTVHPAHL